MGGETGLVPLSSLLLKEFLGLRRIYLHHGKPVCLNILPLKSSRSTLTDPTASGPQPTRHPKESSGESIPLSDTLCIDPRLLPFLSHRKKSSCISSLKDWWTQVVTDSAETPPRPRSNDRPKSRTTVEPDVLDTDTTGHSIGSVYIVDSSTLHRPR